MPVSRRVTEGRAVAMHRLYAGVEVRLLRMMAKHLAAGVGAPDWQQAKLAELQTFRRRAEALLGEANQQAARTVVDTLTGAYNAGQAAAQADLDQLPGADAEVAPRHAERAVANLAAATTQTLEATKPQVLRATVDAYRDAVAKATAGTLTGATTRLQDTQAVLDDLASRGITGFHDSRGRRWQLSTYAEMATRTAAARAAVSGHLDRLEDAGVPLVIVSNSPRECELCRPWEGKVLSRGPVAALQRDVTTGELVTVTVDGTVDEAIRDGLLHPNCTHNLSGYLPGATRRQADTSNAEGYAERQQLRHLERKVREWKRRQAVAITPQARRLADGKVREWQARIRRHTEATGLVRQRHREQIMRPRPRNAPPEVDLTPPDPAPPAPAGPRAVAELSDDELEAELGQLMDAGDYGDRLDHLSVELDARDAARNAGDGATVEVPDEPDPYAEADALNQLLYGGQEARDLTARRYNSGRGARDVELREQYDTYAHTQYVASETATNGHMLSHAGQVEGFDPGRFFGAGRGRYATDAQFRKYASPEVQEWVAGNGRLSFDEFRAGLVDDKRARAANRRRRERTLSEYG